ncbi:MAG: DUF2232 domain-containing protein [Pseudomonadota bacterium]
MASKTLLIAVALGLLTALLNLAPLRVPALGFMLAPFTVLPIFVSVLGLGSIAGGVSAVVGTLAMALTAGLLPAVVFFFILLAPPLYAGHLAGLSRSTDDGVEWYPLEDVLFALTIASALVVVATALLSGLTQADLSKMMAELMGQMRSQGTGAGAPNPADVERATSQIVAALPVAMPASILVMLVMNLYLGSRIARNLGWMARPVDHIPTATALPLLAAIIFGTTVVASLFGGQIGTVGQIFMGAFGMAFAFVGLATIHTITMGKAGRGVILGLVYALLFVFAPSIIGVVILGLADSLLGLRARAIANRGP